MTIELDLTQVLMGILALATVALNGWITIQANKIHKIVNSQDTIKNDTLEALKAEIARLNVNNAIPTPGGGIPEEGRPVVTALDNHVTVQAVPPANP